MEALFNIEAEEDFKSVVNSILDNIYSERNDSSQLIDEISLATAKEEIRDAVLKTSCNSEKIYEHMLSRGLKKPRSQLVSSLIENRKNELLYSTLLNYNSKHGETVVMLDWTVKFVYGTSELKTLKYPLTQFSFTTLNKGHQQQRIYDLNKEMLVKLINTLEKEDVQS